MAKFKVGDRVRIIDKKYTDWYSLREIPEKYDTERPYILDFNEDCKRGYNSCIEEILARGIKHAIEDRHKYCPNCGAKMDESEDEE